MPGLDALGGLGKRSNRLPHCYVLGSGGRRGGMFVNKLRLLAVTLLASGCAVLGLAAPPAFATSSGVGPVIDVSSACPGQNAEVEQAVAPPHYVYEARIGCGGEGFARSTDGGRHFSNPIMLPDSASSQSTFTDDPAVAVAPDGTLYVSWIR